MPSSTAELIAQELVRKALALQAEIQANERKGTDRMSLKDFGLTDEQIKAGFKKRIKPALVDVTQTLKSLRTELKANVDPDIDKEDATAAPVAPGA